MHRIEIIPKLQKKGASLLREKHTHYILFNHVFFMNVFLQFLYKVEKKLYEKDDLN